VAEKPPSPTLQELLDRPRDDRLILQFSTAAPDWRFKNIPQALKKFPFNLLLDRNYGSELIRRANHSPFSHIDMLMKDGTLIGASDSPNAPFIHGNPRGVAQRPFNYQEFAYRRQMVLATHRADDIRRIWVSQLGKGFDNSALKDFISASFPGRRDWRLTDDWFCAEGVVWAMETGGYWGSKPLQWPKNRVSPTDILLMLLNDDRWLNRETFWEPIKGLQLGPHEK
jgi:hypothetical protein